MQVKSSNNILLILLLLIPICISAQIGTKKYVTRSGDTTVIVYAGNTGLGGEDAQFLLDSKAAVQSADRQSRYNKLKDAADETDQVAKIIYTEKKETNPSSGSLGFRIAQKNIRYLQNEQQATRSAREIIHRDASVEELTYLKTKFGEKPSYFINGIQVDPKTAASISDKEILTRSLKVSNTSTGNPNGEVWYVVNVKTFNKLGLDNYQLLDTNTAIANNKVPAPKPSPAYGDEIVEPKTATEPISPVATEQQQKLSPQQLEIEELKKQIEEVRRLRAAIAGTEYKELPATPSTPAPAATTPPRRAQQAEEVVGFKDSPQERTRRERDQMGEPTIVQDDTPKRSVRKIKERERNR